MVSVGTKDLQTVLPGGARSAASPIDGVRIHDLGNVLTRSGFLTEIFRSDWPSIGVTVRQVNWVQLNPAAVTDWHLHSRQTDHLIGVNGTIKLALWDGREESKTKGSTDVVRIGALRPVMVVIPPGVWHGLRNESGEAAGYINLIDHLYDYGKPDNWRLSPDAPKIPDIL